MTNKETKQEEIKQDVLISLSIMKNMIESNKVWGAGSFIEDITKGIKTLKEFSE